MHIEIIKEVGIIICIGMLLYLTPYFFAYPMFFEMAHRKQSNLKKIFSDMEKKVIESGALKEGETGKYTYSELAKMLNRNY